MKTKMFKITTVLLMLAGSVSSCNKNDPAEAILEKWELIAKGETENNMKTIEPNGVYIEFLSEGISHIYNPETDESHYRSYKIDKKFIYYNYDRSYEQGRYDYRYNISKGLLKMTYSQGFRVDMAGLPNIFIYQPKN